MPLPNGVNPQGNIEATCPDAGLMGNRGILHDSLYGPVRKDWQHKAWVACRLGFGNWQRGDRANGKLRLMASLSEYSELFFLDEATALATGHRPCGTCRRADYAQFKSAWCRAKGIEDIDFDPKETDQILHQERCSGRQGVKNSFSETLGKLPDGVMLLHKESPCLLWKGKVWYWHARGYTQGTEKLSHKLRVDVLTPSSIVEVLSAGYRLQVHKTAVFA